MPPLPGVPPPLPSRYLLPEDLRTAYTSDQDLGVDFSVFSDDNLGSLIEKASERIDAYLENITLQTRVYREHYRGTGTNFLRLRHWPLIDGIQTTLAQDAPLHSTSVTLVSAAGVLPGHFLIATLSPLVDGLAQALGVVASVNQATGVAQLVMATAVDYAAGQAVQVEPIDYISIILPGNVRYPIPTGTLIIENELGTVQNWTPLMFQTLGYTSVFPLDMPLEVQYTAGWAYAGQRFPGPVRYIMQDLCVGAVRNVRNRLLTGLESVHDTEHTVKYSPPVNWTVGHLSNEHKHDLASFKRQVGVF